jgi:hypothetical protein
VDAIETTGLAGGLAYYDWECNADGAPQPSRTPPEPAWLRRLFGDDFFATVVAVELDDPETSDATVEQLRALPQVRFLMIRSSVVSNAALPPISGLTRLRKLTLTQCRITDAALQRLECLPHLQWLDLSFTQITDDGTQHLRRLTQLQYLDLTGNRITIPAVNELQEALPGCFIEI